MSPRDPQFACHRTRFDVYITLTSHSSESATSGGRSLWLYTRCDERAA
ncbi:hypothetical protein I545_5104 [Mycobacterium kansasii 662]|uniref:Uncharacterized protein n=1 Tax=Mycobacterium kansasii 662 TaxID=1299326 RepID=X7Z1H1_MYCKA|nr:hypothetical protein I547_2823 [Mycobacterium kansasii 824]EUA12618.1 hypothetical protein I545_5104 [Mycobacterium kansasii 662]